MKRWWLLSVFSVVAVVATTLVVPVSPAGAVGPAAHSYETAALPAGNARFVDSAVRDLLGRASTAADQSNWTARLDGGWSRGEFAREVATTPEWARVLVTDLYQKVLGRGPDPAGLTYWAGLLSGGRRTAELASAMYASEEFFQAAGGGTVPGYVDAVYRNILERDPDDAGRAYWIELLQSGTPRGSIAYAFFLTVESNAKRVDVLYDRLLNRDPEEAGRQYWAEQLVTVDDLVLSGLLVGSDEYYANAQDRYEEANVVTKDGTYWFARPDLTGIAINEDGTGTLTLAPGVAAPPVGAGFLAGDKTASTPTLVVGAVTSVSTTGSGSTVSFAPGDITDLTTSFDVVSTVEVPVAASVRTADGGPSPRIAVADFSCSGGVQTEFKPSVRLDQVEGAPLSGPAVMGVLVG